jgi:Cu/Ag efflux protein CusF
MLRTFVCAAVALVLCAGVALADDAKPAKKKASEVRGTVKKIDAAASTITLTIKNKKTPDGMEKEFKIAEDTKFTVITGEDKKEMSAKDGFKSDALKEGALLTIAVEGDKVTAVTIGGGKKKKDK